MGIMSYLDKMAFLRKASSIGYEKIDSKQFWAAETNNSKYKVKSDFDAARFGVFGEFAPATYKRFRLFQLEGANLLVAN